MSTQKEKEDLVRDNNIELRILSSIVIGTSFIISILWIPILLYPVILLVGSGMMFEWYNMTKTSLSHVILGLFIILIPVISLILLAITDINRWLLLTYFATLWSVDTFAMIGGKSLKGPKLCSISPNKTWSGLIIGIISAGVTTALLSKIPGFNIIQNSNLLRSDNLILTSMVIAGMAQVSDLFISYFKRKFDIKDTGNLIPGHGGVLDRFDSIILTAPLLLLAVYL